ncbi:MAG: zinc dependent phospholipase C family protein [Deltaproteobacteria bacterium]|nr:zinc dependent phospholipase C family protein [Deltaproteobacteria bacterium]
MRLRPRPLDVVLAALLVLLLPEAARAWGGAAHIDFGTESLRWLALVVPFVRRLLLAHPAAYLYGAFLADNVVGKNRAPANLHCHSWSVGRGLLDVAGDPVERSFAVGYAAHLAADEVAHREFIPAKLVESFPGRGLRHVYWELRFDSRVLQMRPDVIETWRQVAEGERAEGLRKFLARHLHPALLSHGASHSLFAGTMAMQRRTTWLQAAQRVDRHSPFPLSAEEFEWYRERSVDAVLGFLSDPDGERSPPHDAVGAAEIEEAKRLRRGLRRARRSRPVSPEALARLGPALRLAAAARRPLAAAVHETLGWSP